MAYRSIRDHSNMRYADSFTQDMDFWRQRIDKEEGFHMEGRRHMGVSTGAFATSNLDPLPRNPFKDSAGMLHGDGVSPRREHTALGVLSPDLAAYRAAVIAATHSARPNSWHLGNQAPYHLASSMSLPSTASPQARAMRGAERLRLAPANVEEFRAPKQFEKHLIIDAPNQRVCASLRRGMPRSRLDARMYAHAPG